MIMNKRPQLIVFLSLMAMCGLLRPAEAAPPAPSTPFDLVIAAEDLDSAAYTSWVNGVEQQMKPAEPRQAIWNRDNSPGLWNGVSFGEGTAPGPRHLRFGFTRPINLGTIVSVGNISISALKPGVAYPGKIDDDSQWIPLERISAKAVQSDQKRAGEYGVWLLPQTTSVRAIRFTHIPAAADSNYAGKVEAAYLLSRRLINFAPQGKLTTSVREDMAHKLNNEVSEVWGAWDNRSLDAKGKNVPEPGQPWAMIYWTQPVTLCGLNIQFAGCSAIEVQTYAGPADRHPREAANTDWRPVKSFGNLKSFYPWPMGMNWLDFGRNLSTRALRIRMTKAMDEAGVHPHMSGQSEGGRRYFASEIMAFGPASSGPLSASIVPTEADTAAKPPIALPFTLDEPGVVTLVIEDAQGKRIRNLVSETPFPAGKNVAYWDAMDDLARDTEAARHGLYHVPGQFVPTGEYRVRGLVHKPLSLKYEFSLYYDGTPPWETPSGSGGWLTNHTPPNCTLFVPADKTPNGQPMVYIGSHIAEGGSGLAWVNLEGRKIGGRMWVGGIFTGAQYLCRDLGPNADPTVFTYVGSVFEKELRLNGLAGDKDKPILKWSFPTAEDTVLNGIAVHDGVIVCSLPKLNSLLFVDAKATKAIGTVAMADPRGVTFEPDGSLLVLTGTRLVRFPALGGQMIDPSAGKAVIASGLEDPRQVIRDAQGQFLVSDGGQSHQVKVFSPAGELVRSIGNAGSPAAGPYDPLHMNNPNGITIDSSNQLWVAENDSQPKRVSVWSMDGKLIRTMYGPPEYGGGGRLDHKDKTLYYYNGMEFKLDWEKGSYRLANVFHRPLPGAMELVGGPPEYPHYANGHRYWSNSYNSTPVDGTKVNFLWIDRNGVAVPAAAFGQADRWNRLKADDVRSRWPENTDPKNGSCAFLWTDGNADGQLQPDEVNMWKAGGIGGVVVQDDLSYVISRIDGKAMRVRTQGFTAQGVPIYDWAKAEVLADKVQGSASSGGDQALADDQGRMIATLGIEPYHSHSVSGALKGVANWSYPNLWPGLHASHEAAVPEFPGELVGVTRLAGGLLNPKGSEVGPLWCVNANMGNLYMMTTDGLFVSTLYHDVRTAPLWVMPTAERGMEVGQLSLHDENFWPSITQTSDGNVYVVSNMAIVRIDGLDSLRKLSLPNVRLTEQDLKASQAYVLQRELSRQKSEGKGILKVAMTNQSPKVDADLSDWDGATWVTVDRRGIAANFDSNSKPYSVDAAVAVDAQRLYVAYRSNEPQLLKNSGTVPNAPFKTGGALDIMIGTDKTAKPDRPDPVQGDVRLLVTMINDKPYALVYHAVVPGTKDKVPFSSPWRTIYMDKVENVSSQVQLAGKDGLYELSIPLTAVGLKPEGGMVIKGDVGVLRGNGFQTSQRAYWNNKATGITADVPSEAQLTPALWGRWEFSPMPATSKAAK